MRGAGCGACAREEGRPPPLSGGLGSSSGLTTGLCRSRLDEDRMKAEKSAGSGIELLSRPVPEVRSRGQKSPRRSADKAFRGRASRGDTTPAAHTLPRRVFRRSSSLSVERRHTV